ncbi:MAG: hypothetical protein KME57_02430 [Scytonema hyalinum WJT4-NPBG1]|jgi:WD40 repeat protein|nr:hypothetical protein [Scytonema hyalinum WJT4-NPBG1]
MGKVAEKLAAKSPAFQRARLKSLPYSLAQSKQLEKYYQTLTDFDFIAAKINHSEFGVQPLIDDYDLIDDPELFNHPEYNQEKVKALKLIQGALLLSAHILQQDTKQLAGQLWGRMQHFAMPEIQAMLEVAKQRKVSPWLRPLTPSLTPPGGRLLRTFKGHSDSVEAVAVTTDGKKVISGSYDNTLKLWSLETGEIIATFTGESSLRCCAVAPDGVTIVAGEESGRVHFLRLEGMA